MRCGQKSVSAYIRSLFFLGSRFDCNIDLYRWTKADYVQFKHVDTGKYLVTSSQQKFDQRNCGQSCPIMGQSEIACTANTKVAGNIRWKAAQGVYFPPKTTNDKDEL